MDRLWCDIVFHSNALCHTLALLVLVCELYCHDFMGSHTFGYDVTYLWFFYQLCLLCPVTKLPLDVSGTFISNVFFYISKVVWELKDTRRGVTKAKNLYVLNFVKCCLRNVPENVSDTIWLIF